MLQRAHQRSVAARCGLPPCALAALAQQQDDLAVFTLLPSPGRTVAPPVRDAIGWLAILHSSSSARVDKGCKGQHALMGRGVAGAAGAAEST
jgi:hypothetical protein